MTGIVYPWTSGQPFVTNTYDSLGRVKTQTNVLGATWQYFPAGTRSEEVDPYGMRHALYSTPHGKTRIEIQGPGRREPDRHHQHLRRPRPADAGDGAGGQHRRLHLRPRQQRAHRHANAQAGLAAVATGDHHHLRSDLQQAVRPRRSARGLSFSYLVALVRPTPSPDRSANRSPPAPRPCHAGCRARRGPSPPHRACLGSSAR